MKRNKKTYLLLALVLSIWGILGFRILRTLGPDPGPGDTAQEPAKFTWPKGKDRDTFHILADYRDPFLGTVPTVSPVKNSGARPTPPKKEPIPIDIRYTGFVKEKTTGRKIFFVQIDGEQRMLSKNESFKEAKLLSGNEGMIKVRVKGKNLDITRSR